MRKSVLVIDTPENCSECDLHETDFNGKYYCAADGREIEPGTKPTWCPLLVMPRLSNNYQCDGFMRMLQVMYG